MLCGMVATDRSLPPCQQPCAPRPPPPPPPPPACRCISGYNFAYNLAFGVLGGISPLVVTAINSSLKANGRDTTFGPAWWILAGGVGTVFACVAIRWHQPHCNYTQTQWEKRQAAAASGAGQAGKAEGEAGAV